MCSMPGCRKYIAPKNVAVSNSASVTKTARFNLARSVKRGRVLISKTPPQPEVVPQPIVEEIPKSDDTV